MSITVPNMPLLKELLVGRACLLMGSAPLTKPVEFVSDEERLIVVNGAISSLRANPDVWVLNSRTGPYPSWGAEQKRLSRLMLRQGAGRRVKLLVLLAREADAVAVTLAQLRALGTVVGAVIALTQNERRAVEKASGLRRQLTEHDALSAGFTGAALATWAGATSLRMEGFSWDAGYQYLPGERIPSKRGHESGDKRALADLIAIYGAALSHPFTTTAPPPKEHRMPTKATSSKTARGAAAHIRKAEDRSRRPAGPTLDQMTAEELARHNRIITVRAVRMGYFKYQRRRPGSVFQCRASEFSERWMEQVADQTPLMDISIQEQRRREHSEILAARSPASQLQPNAVDPLPVPKPMGADYSPADN